MLDIYVVYIPSNLIYIAICLLPLLEMLERLIAVNNITATELLNTWNFTKYYGKLHTLEGAWLCLEILYISPLQSCCFLMLRGCCQVTVLYSSLHANLLNEDYTSKLISSNVLLHGRKKLQGNYANFWHISVKSMHTVDIFLVLFARVTCSRK